MQFPTTYWPVYFKCWCMSTVWSQDTGSVKCCGYWSKINQNFQDSPKRLELPSSSSTRIMYIIKDGKPHFLVVSTNFLSEYFVNTWWHYVLISKRHWHDIMALELQIYKGICTTTKLLVRKSTSVGTFWQTNKYFNSDPT